jgi:flavin-dependent dehydrogenase
LWLARAGYDVELLDRHAFPRAKPCGDCISPGANAIFRRMGVWQQVAASGAARLTGWTLCSSPAASFTSRFSAGSADSDTHYGFAVARERLDMILLEAARAAGVAIRTGAQITQLLRSSDERVTGVAGNSSGAPFTAHARLIVGADGLRSRVARLLNAYARAPRLRKLSLTAHVRGVPAVSELGEMHISNGACLGVARVEAGSDPACNITAVVRAEQAPAHEGAHLMMRSLLQRFPQRDLSHLIQPNVEVLACGPFDWPVRQIVFDGAALVGDAAGYYDPFTGQGIFQALAGGELLAEHARHALKQRVVSKRTLARYAAAQRGLVKNPRRVQRAIEYVCARPGIAETVFAALNRAPDAAARLVAVTGDVRPVRDLLSPVTLASLFRAVLYPAA